MRIGNHIAAVLSTTVSGLSNVLVQLLFATALSADEFGYFTLASTTLLVVLALGRVFGGQMDLIVGKAQKDLVAINGAYLISVVIAVVGSIAFLVCIISSSEVGALLALGVLAGAPMVLRDSLRYRAFREGRAGTALLSDTATLISVLVGIVLWSQNSTPQIAMGIWSAGALTGFLIAAPRIEFYPSSAKLGWQWITGNWKTTSAAALEFVLQAGVPYFLNFLIVIVAGPAALGGYRLIQILFAAVSNLATGLNALTVPKIVDSRSTRTARSALAWEGALLTLISLLLIIVAISMPTDYAHRLFGETWSNMVPFLWAGAIHGWVTALSVSVFSILRYLGLAIFSLMVRVGSVVFTGTFALVATIMSNAVGIAWAITMGAVLAHAVRLIRLRGELSVRGENL